MKPPIHVDGIALEWNESEREYEARPAESVCIIVTSYELPEPGWHCGFDVAIRRVRRRSLGRRSIGHKTGQRIRRKKTRGSRVT